jgi:hypothetical protein
MYAFEHLESKALCVDAAELVPVGDDVIERWDMWTGTRSTAVAVLNILGP